jgi:hypothetical protein
MTDAELSEDRKRRGGVMFLFRFYDKATGALVREERSDEPFPTLVDPAVERVVVTHADGEGPSMVIMSVSEGYQQAEAELRQFLEEGKKRWSGHVNPVCLLLDTAKEIAKENPQRGEGWWLDVLCGYLEDEIEFSKSTEAA